MAAKRRDPTVTGQTQIEGKFHNILEGKLEFISIAHMKSWYGRYDEVAVSKLNTAWKQYLRKQPTPPRRIPKLFAVGPIAKLKGYAICRNDMKKNWLY